MKNLAQALNKMQGAMPPAIKDASNPAFKSRYADLASVWDAIRKPLADNGLSVTQQTDVTDSGHMILVTTVWHISGESLAARYPLTPTQNTPQSVGSCISYARRYSISALLGVVQDDDDGNAASQGAATGDRKVTPPAPPPKPAEAKGSGAKAAPNNAAKTWADAAAKTIAAMSEPDEVDAWAAMNAAHLERLQSVQPELYTAVMTIVQTTHDTLSRRVA